MKAVPIVKGIESRFLKLDRLMPFRVRRILLVSSLYDSYVLEEDGQLAELIYNEYIELNLTVSPHVRRASNMQEALEILKTHDIDLVIIFKRVADIDAVSFGHEVKKIKPLMPVILLAYDEQEIPPPSDHSFRDAIDRAFIWTGDVSILLAIIKLVEDWTNIDNDTNLISVRVIILIEDSVKFYSSYLPLLYTEILQQTNALMAEGLNLTDRLMRMRARPKILLADTYESGWELYRKYREHTLGIISDFRFSKDGQLDDEAGLLLVQRVRREDSELPILMQSSGRRNEAVAAAQNAGFLYKLSPTLHMDLSEYIMEHFGFGDFVFKLADGSEVARATNFRSMEKCLSEVSDKSLMYHARRNHFSNWLMARTEFDLASRLRPRKVSEFKDSDDLRLYLIQTFRNFRHRKQRGQIIDFSRQRFDLQSDFVRIGRGSLGGKGRGLAFVNALLARYGSPDELEDVRLAVPFSAVIGSEEFDRFLDDNKLRQFALEDRSDDEIVRRFVKGSLSRELSADLQALLDFVDYPLAVRSSSLLEDSHLQPFAGIYETHMLANAHSSMKERAKQLRLAIKLVYASTYMRRTKLFHEATGSRVEEEKMAVIIQRAIGREHGQFFYPHISGVASSFNFYSIDGGATDEGVAHVALGFGKTIMDGMNCLRFSPAQPERLVQFSTVKDMFNNSQREFYAIDLSRPGLMPRPGGDRILVKLPISQAETDGTLNNICSTYSVANDRVYDGTTYEGVRIITFAPILKHNRFPLTDTITYMLDVGSQGLNCPVEIEFAVDLEKDEKGKRTFYFLQIRPMVKEATLQSVTLDETDIAGAICVSNRTLGNMHERTITDLVVVDPSSFDRSRTVSIAAEIGTINQNLQNERRQYLLIGPGRWGTSERWLGIPTSWEQISAAKVIVEAAYGDFAVDPSFGTHFFQNLTSFQIGYFTINEAAGNGRIDWDWILAQPVINQTELVRHVRLSEPLDIRIDGHAGRGLVAKGTQRNDR
ncbi:MAG: PEP/pyruvate-binding domain-containing protein [Candidatus Zixiibacteriota bacterium]